MPSDSGYGRVGKGYARAYDPIRKRTGLAHRVAWEAIHGPVPEGMTVGHLCHDEAADRGECADLGDACPHRVCVNVEHLALQTQRENNRGSYRDGVCNHGHDLETEGTNGNRLCRACQCEWKRKWRADRRAKGLKVS